MIHILATASDAPPSSAHPIGFAVLPGRSVKGTHRPVAALKVVLHPVPWLHSRFMPGVPFIFTLALL